MTRSGGHWSRPAARRVLDALMSLGGQGTTWQILEITHSTAVHQDIYCLRCWLQFEHGFDEADTHEAVKREDLGANKGGRQVVRYTLREDVKALHRRIRREESAVSSEQPAPGPERVRELVQKVLFQTTGAAERRRQL